MTDIDFDELDKAVNSALAPREAAKAESPTVAEPAAMAPSTPSATQSPEPKKTEDSPRIILTPRPRQPIDSPAAKRSGRFMDMVHPSSDMANEKKPAPAPAAKVKLMPLGDDLKPDEADKTDKAEAPEKVETPVVVTKPDPEIAEAKPANEEVKPESKEAEPEIEMKSEYPDPIDVAGPMSIAEEPAKPDEASAPAAEASAPAEAPFLPDAKVEKRPLGGFAPDEPVPEDEGSTQDDESQLPPETSLPAALQSDVVAVESDALPDPLQGLSIGDEEKDEAHDEKPAEPEEKPEPETTEPVAVPKHNEGPAQSIPQQYHAEPAKADEDPRPVFDTDQYHQPLIAAHAGKKNHVWVFILLVAALLAIGGTLGYFAFMSGL